MNLPSTLNIITLLYLHSFHTNRPAHPTAANSEPFCAGFSQEGLYPETHMKPSFPLNTLVCCCFINPEKVN